MTSKSSSISATPSPPYSKKLESLFAYLEEQENSDNDKLFASTDDGGDAPKHPRNSNNRRGGLSDITNHVSPTAAKAQIVSKKIPSQNKKIIQNRHDCVDSSRKTTKPLVRRDRKKSYIWEEWEEQSLLNSIDDICMSEGIVDVDMASGEEFSVEKSIPDTNKGLPADAHEQLRELKSMSLEIQTRSTAMKIECEQKKKKVEELHSVRVENEARYVAKMKSVKQFWAKRHEVAKAENDRMIVEQEKLSTALETECNSLQTHFTQLKVVIEKITKSEEEMSEKLKANGAHELEEAKKGWAHAEQAELKKRDTKLSPKLKKDSAKAVEPKLRQLTERNKEEIERLEREAARELDCYKLELYAKANQEFKKEVSHIRSDERKRVEKSEADWMARLETERIEHEADTKKAHHDHQRRSAMLTQQFNADKQKCIDEHDIMLEDAKKAETIELDQMQASHKREIAAIEEDYSNKMAQRQNSCEEDFRQWKVERDAELLMQEDTSVNIDHDKLKRKVQAEIDLVERKLRDEANEKRVQVGNEVAKKNMAIKQKYDAEINDLEGRIQKNKQKEEREANKVRELRKKLADLKSSLASKEDKISIQETRLKRFHAESEQKVADTHKDGERKYNEVMREKASLDKELDKLHASKQQDDWVEELESMKDVQAKEITRAETKIQKMIESKRAILDRASDKLVLLRQEVTNMDRDLDAARKQRVLGR